MNHKKALLQTRCLFLFLFHIIILSGQDIRKEATNRNTVFQLTAFYEKQAITLQWAHNSPTGVQYFQVERSKNGEHFQGIFSLKPSSLQGGLEVYKYRDELPIQGANYYRVKLLDTLNNVLYSNLQTLTFHRDPELIFYPNPVLNQLHLVYKHGRTPITLEIINQFGQVVLFQQITENLSADRVILLPTLPNGNYFIKIRVKESGKPILTNKLVVSKLY